MAGKFTVGDLLALIRVDRTEFDRGVDGAERKLRTSAARQSKMLDGLQDGWKKLGKVMATTGKVGGIALAGIVAGGAGIQAIGGLVTALAPLVGLLVALPALGLAGAASFGVLKIGLAGFGDALKGKPEALAKLSENGRHTVDVLNALRPAWDAVRRATQDALFQDVGRTIKDLAGVWLPKLNNSLPEIAYGFSRWAVEAAKAAGSSQFVDQIQESLVFLAGGLMDASAGVGPLVLGFGALVQAATPILRDMAPGFASIATAMGDWLVQANQSGLLTQILRDALATLAQLGRIVLQLGGIFGAVFSAANQAGGGFLNNLEEILKAVNAFLSAGEGRTAMIALFAGVSSVLHQLMPVVFGVLGQLGPGIQALLTGLADGLAALAPAAGPVGKAISDIAVAVAPLLPVLGGVLAGVLVALANALSSIAAVGGPLISMFAELATLLMSQLMPPMLEFGQRVLPDLVTLGLGLADAFRPLVPVIVEMSQTFLSGLLPSLMGLADIFRGEVIPQLIQAAYEVAPALLDVLKQLMPHIPDLTKSFVQLAIAALQLGLAFLPLMPYAVELIKNLTADGGVGLIGLINVLVGAMVVATFTMSFWAAAIRDVIGWVQGLGRKFGELKDTITAVFSGAGSWLWNAGRDIIQGLINGVNSGVDRLKSALRHITDMLPSWKGPAEVDRKILAPTGRLIMAGLVDGINTAVPNVRKALGDLTVSLPAAAAPPSTTVNVAAPAAQPFDVREFARAVKAALTGLDVRLDSYAIGRVQGDTADLFATVG